MAIVPEDSVTRSPGVRLAMAGVAAVVIIADQVSKTLVLALHPAAGAGWVTVRLVRNTGANGGIGAGYPVAVTLAAILIAGLAGAFALRARSRATAFFLAAVLGGALGNLSDRVFRSHHGAVVDFIAFHFWPTFNVADSCVVAGSILLVLLLWRSHPQPASGKQAPGQQQTPAAGDVAQPSDADDQGGDGE